MRNDCSIRQCEGGWIVTDRYGTEYLCATIRDALWRVALHAGMDTIHNTITVTPNG